MVGIATLGTILVVKYGEVKKIETDDVTLCYIITFFCWLIPIIAFTILARTLGFWLHVKLHIYFIPQLNQLILIISEFLLIFLHKNSIFKIYIPLVIFFR